MTEKDKVLLETLIISAAVDALIADGYSLTMYKTGESDVLLFEDSTSAEGVVTAMHSSKEEILYVRTQESNYKEYSVRFVYGQSPFQCMRRHHADLYEALRPVRSMIAFGELTYNLEKRPICTSEVTNEKD